MNRLISFIFFLAFLSLESNLIAQDCDCTNCPVAITDNNTFQGFLDVTVAGPNDLSLCGLEQVCFTINHTWIGDLALTLTSPGGLNYLVMADSGNGSGGCGTNADNINICVTTGTGNPVTNNGAYTCNGGNPCLVGNWTVPCGGVTDPISGAVQAPGCDLSAFNQPGQPANGTWTLTINDVCGADTGSLVDWSLDFSCGTASCVDCVAEGGVLNQADLTGCMGSPDLNLNINPIYTGANIAPTPAADYSYTFLVSQNGFIVPPFNVDGPSLSGLSPGSYQICGLSYENTVPPIFATLNGMNITTLGNDLNSDSAPFCGDISDDCFNVTIISNPPPILITEAICVGEAFVLPDGSFCFSPDICVFFDNNTCQETTYNITPLLPTSETINETVCQGQCFNYEGVDYCNPSQVIQTTNADDCLHIITLNLSFIDVTSIIVPPGQLSCTNTNVTLDGSNSSGDTFEWTNAAGQVLGTGATLNVTAADCYTLTVSNTSVNPACVAQETVCVTSSGGGLPTAPTIMGSTPVCAPELGTYSVVNDASVTYTWTISGNGNINDGQGTNTLGVNWVTAGMAQVCVTSTNACGTSAPSCFDVTINAAPNMPIINGDIPVCPNGTGSYSVPTDSNATSYLWTVPTGAIITSGQGGSNISVTFGSVAGNVCVVANNLCGDSPENCFPVTLFDLPANAQITGPESVCPGETVTYSTPIDINTTDYTWNVPACANIDSGQGTQVIVVTWNQNCAAGGDICVTVSNDCGMGTPDCLPVDIGNSPPAPTVAGTTNVCLNDNANYNINSVPGALNYIWTITGGSIDNGQGTPDVEVTWTSVGNQEICASVQTDCGISAPNCLDITVLDIPAIPVIDGDTPLCVNQLGNYEITSATVAGDTFSWSVSGGGNIQGGNSNSSVDVNWTMEGIFDICVTVTNACGDNQACFPVTINPATALPEIGGPNSVCQNSTESYFVTNPVIGETYDWQVPAGATIIAGPSTDQISINWGTSLGGDVCVTATGICGITAPVCLDVSTDGVPALGAVVGDDLVCSGTQNIYSIGNLSTATGYTWAADCGTILAGQNSTEITLQIDANCTSIELCVTADTDCGATSPSCITISIENVPSPTSEITGTTPSCVSAMDTYCAALVDEADSYNWTVTGGNIISGQDSECIEIEWTTAGTGNLCVTPINNCGAGTEFCIDVPISEVTAMPVVVTDTEVCACDVTNASVDATDAIDIDWIVPTGATITSGQGTDNIIIDWCDAEAGDVCVTLTYACGTANACTSVLLSEIPVADAGQDNAICGLAYNLNATASFGTGTWEFVGAGTANFTDENDPQSSVTVTDFGNYTFTWTEDNNTCANSDDVLIAFNNSPSIDGLIAKDCNDTNTAYTISFTVINGLAPFSLSPDLAGDWAINTFTSNEITSEGTYSFTITDANGCSSQEYIGQHTCDCTTDPGTMLIEALDACENGTVQVIHNGDQVLDGDDISQFILSDGDPINGQVFDTNNTGEFGLVTPMETETTYFISFAVGNDDGNGNVDFSASCALFTEGVPVIFHAYPNPDAGLDDEICGLTYTLSATADISGGSWNQTSGAGIADFFDENAANTEVTVSEFGIYTFVWSEDNNGCLGDDAVQISFNDAPILDGIQTEVCDLATSTYTVSFTISGGQAPYFINDVMIAGNNYTSAAIGSNIPYNFAITDSNGCGPTMVTGVRNCDCVTDPGTMEQTLQEVCIDGIASGLPLGDEFIETNEDAIQYIIHDGNGTIPGTIFGTSDSPDFSLIAPMEVGVTYYISTIVGDDLGGGVVDLADPCFRIAVGTPVLFRPLPSGSIAEDAMICEGSSIDIEFNLIGTAPFTVEFDGQTITDQPNTFTQTVSPLTTTTYSLTQVIDALGCVATVNSAVTITVNTPPTSTLAMNGLVCNSTDNGNPTTLNFANFITDGDTTGTWEDTDDSGATGDFASLNFEGITPNDYTFTYTTGNAIAPCQNVSYTIEITVEDCVCPSVATSAPNPICNDGGFLDLTTLQITSEAGTWQIIQQPIDGTADLNGNTFDAMGVLAGEYIFEFTLTNNPPVGCPTTSQEILIVNQAVNAGTPNAALSFCQNDGQNINLFDELIGADTNGNWTEISNNLSTENAFNTNTGIFNPTGQIAGTYTFQYTITANAPCSDDFSIVTVIVNPLPNADAGETQTITCIELDAQLGGNSTIGSEISYNWEASNGGMIEESQLDVPDPVVLMAGTYSLTVSNEFGCTDIDQVIIEAANDLPIPEFTLSPISCFGESDGVIAVDTVTGGQAPYVYSMDGINFNTTSFFTGLKGGEYTVYVQDSNGCMNSVLFDIPEPNEMNVELFAFIEGENSILFGDSIELGFQASVPTDSLDLIAWTPSNILNCDSCATVTATPYETTNFSLTVSADGCPASDNLTIVVRKEAPIYVPNIFSPNGDGTNDIFFIFAGTQVAKVNSFLVFNRWGETIYQYYNFLPNDPATGWDGTHRGEPMNPAVFAWYAEIELIDGRIEILQGDVTLAR